MRRFDSHELVRFLRALDAELDPFPSHRLPIIVVGGAAASVAYDSDTRTLDIDVYAGLTPEILEAAQAARQSTGLRVVVDSATVTDLPYDHEDRLRELDLGLRRLSVVVPDKYDLALSKTMRGYEHDREAIAGMHAHHRLAKSTLVRRFEEELMPIAIADKRKICLNVALLAARLWGDDAGRELAARWGVPVPSEPGLRSKKRP